MQSEIVEFIFANFLDEDLVWNYAMGGLWGNGRNGYGSHLHVDDLNSLKFRLSPKNRPREWRVG
jgi:hypothetical protein